MSQKEQKMEQIAPFQTPITYNFAWLGSYAGKRCEHFEKQWLDCASQLGLNRANVECKLEFGDLKECEKMDIAYKGLAKPFSQHFT